MTKIPLKPANELFTDKQWQSIFDGGDNLLISASAGSGKTTVLVRRVIEKLKSGSNIDELLIVTYTEVAAREMKERIQVALQDAVNQESDPHRREHFTKQLILLPTANISTLHAFCLTVIRRFYYLIDLDPVFRMLTDETEMLLLKEDVWNDLREMYYIEQTEAFYQLTANFSNDRNDDGLTDLVMSLYEFARANPNPKEWLRQLVTHYRATEAIEKSSLYQDYVKEDLLSKLKQIFWQYDQGQAITAPIAGLEKVTELLQVEAQQVYEIETAVEDDRLSDAFHLLHGMSFSRYPSIRKEELKDYASGGKAYRDQAKKALDALKTSFFANSPADMLLLLEKAQPLVEQMAEVTTRFMEEYSKRKQEKGVLDFNDLEHFTLQILQSEVNGELVPSEAATYYRNKFKEVLVDEYQDVNRLQEAILSWLCSPQLGAGNLFMVGDVKQSIYSFRLADPTLFIEKYDAFAENQGGRRIILAENFRSRGDVLDFTNLVFQQLMDPAVGQISYDQAAELVTGFPDFPDSQQFLPELLIYEKENESDSFEGIEDKTDGELYMTGLKIRQLIDQGFEIYDKKSKTNRPLRYRDIVLLTPTKKNNLAILDVFKTLDIPLAVNDAQNYFQATEIRIMISLLQLIDNPYQDIPLAAVLRSPMVGLLEDELAAIRLANRKGSFYEAVLRYSQQAENPTQKKLHKFLSQLDTWRELARRESIVELLWRIYEETAYLDYVLGLPAGKQRHANLLALVDRGKAYEQMSFRGLYQFIRFIEKMQEKEKDLAEPVAETLEDAVRVMTIHASKGLEFPVVFILDMTKEFNLQDTKARYMFEEQLGAGIRYLDEENRVLYDTLPYQVIKQMKLKKLLSEEMRKLYVALTRAEQKLYLVGSYQDQEATLKAWEETALVDTLVIPKETRLKTKSSLMNWVGYTLIRHPAMSAYYQEERRSIQVIDQHPGNFSIEWFNQNDLAAIHENLTQPPTIKVDAMERLAGFSVPLLSENLTFTYLYPEAVVTTSYQSVSEVKRVFDDPDNHESNQLSWEESHQRVLNQRFRHVQQELAEPKFMATEKTIAATAIGTASHLLLQLIDLNQQPDAAAFEKLLNELVRQRSVEPEVAEKVRIDALVSFFDSELGQALLNDPQAVKREHPFAMLMPADQLFADYHGKTDQLLIHGIVDGFIEKADELILYDFKTDYVEDSGTVIQRYLGQLRLYKRALEESLNKPVTKVYLVLLSNNQVVNITEEL